MNHTFPLDFTTFDKSDFDDLFFCLLKFPKQNPAQIYLSIILKFYNYPIFYSQLKASKAVATSNICHIVDHLFTFTPKICQHTHKQPGRGSFNNYVAIIMSFFNHLPISIFCHDWGQNLAFLDHLPTSYSPRS